MSPKEATMLATSHCTDLLYTCTVHVALTQVTQRRRSSCVACVVCGRIMGIWCGNICTHTSIIVTSHIIATIVTHTSIIVTKYIHVGRGFFFQVHMAPCGSTIMCAGVQYLHVHMYYNVKCPCSRKVTWVGVFTPTPATYSCTREELIKLSYLLTTYVYSCTLPET